MRNVLIFKKRPQINRIIRINSLVTSLYKNLVNPINPGSKKTFILYLLSYILLAQRVTPWAVKKTLADYADATDVFAVATDSPSEAKPCGQRLRRKANALKLFSSVESSPTGEAQRTKSA